MIEKLYNMIKKLYIRCYTVAEIEVGYEGSRPPISMSKYSTKKPCQNPTFRALVGYLSDSTIATRSEKVNFRADVIVIRKFFNLEFLEHLFS